MSLPDIYTSPQLQKNCDTIKKAAKEHHYPLVFTSTQMERIEEALSLAIDDAIEAMSDEPGGRHEIQPYLDGYQQIFTALKQAKAANKGAKNEDWSGNMS